MPLESLNLKMLTYKLIALVAPTTAARAQTLSALYLNYMSLFHDKVSFTINSLLKTSRPGRRNPDIVIYKFDDSIQKYATYNTLLSFRLILRMILIHYRMFG